MSYVAWRHYDFITPNPIAKVCICMYQMVYSGIEVGRISMWCILVYKDYFSLMFRNMIIMNRKKPLMFLSAAGVEPFVGYIYLYIIRTSRTECLIRHKKSEIAICYQVK